MGVETVVDEVEYKKRIQQPYALFNLVLSEDIRYRVESTPVSLTAAKIGENDGGWYKYRLPKMPMGILKSLYCFFADVAEKFKTEVLVRVYYDPAAEKYVLEVPGTENSTWSCSNRSGADSTVLAGYGYSFTLLLSGFFFGDG